MLKDAVQQYQHTQIEFNNKQKSGNYYTVNKDNFQLNFKHMLSDSVNNNTPIWLIKILNLQ